MDNVCSESGLEVTSVLPVRRLYAFIVSRAYSAIVLGALFCTLLVKFFHAWRQNMVHDYFDWIPADIAVLLSFEVVLAAMCFRWPRKLVVRVALGLAAIVCTWSVINAAWLIRKGMQILPTDLLYLSRDPINSFRIIGGNLAKMPTAAMILLTPSAIALAFFFVIFAKPRLPNYNRRPFTRRILISLLFVLMALLARGTYARRGSAQIGPAELRHNCQLRAVMSFLPSGSGRLTRADLAQAKRKIPAFDQIQLALKPQQVNHNVVIVVLEGIQYRYTSMADAQANLTPHLAALAEHGAEFANARSSVTHTTKALFALLTGRFPSASHDLVEVVPAVKPYASIATILRGRLDFRTAFFQSAKGNFESRPGLVYNLGFEKFWARDDLGDPNAFVGSLGCDEFSMLKPIVEWIKADDKPFLLTVLGSVSHDPYVVPHWYAEPAKEHVERYRQTVSYTDKFIAALDTELAKLNLTDKTIFCVVGDHGEAFGEHGLHSHERIAFEEVVRIPWVMRAPFLIERGSKITEPVSSADLTPTLLALLGFEAKAGNFDGINVLGDIPHSRKVYFSDWKHDGPTGFIKGNLKFIYYPTTKMLSVYDLSADPLESARIEGDEQETQKIVDEIITWRKSSVFRLDQVRTGKKMLFGRWLCRWNNRLCTAKYRPAAKATIIDK